MADFTVIETQEQLDAIVNARLETEKKAFEDKYKGFMSPEDYNKKKTEFETQIGGLNNSIKEKDAKIAAYEVENLKVKVARENGMPFESVQFLQGTDEKSIKESADSLKGLIGNSKRVPPLANNEQNLGNENREAMKKLLAGVKGDK